MSFDITKFLPKKVCCCCLDFGPGVKILLSLIVLHRFVGMILGCFYGPYIYLVLPLSGLFVAMDFLLFYVLFRQDLESLGNNKKEEPIKYTQKGSGSDDETSGCEFPSQRVWIISWIVLNVLAIISLLIGIGFFLNDLGFWSMSFDPIHIAIFFIALSLVILLIYGSMILFTLYVYLKEAWLQSLIGDEERAGLTAGGRRVSM